jgi:hypothetical protein
VFPSDKQTTWQARVWAYSIHARRSEDPFALIAQFLVVKESVSAPYVRENYSLVKLNDMRHHIGTDAFLLAVAFLNQTITLHLDLVFCIKQRPARFSPCGAYG